MHDIWYSRLSRLKYQRKVVKNVCNLVECPHHRASNQTPPIECLKRKYAMCKGGETTARNITNGKHQWWHIYFSPGSEPLCNSIKVAHFGWPKSRKHNHIPINNTEATKRFGCSHKSLISSSWNANVMIGRRRKNH